MRRIDATNRNRRRICGAVMMETVLIMPFVLLILVLMVYLGWNFRRLAQATNMDRYAVWEQVTPGAPGPDVQGLEQPMRNPRLNQVFYDLNGDHALDLDELQAGDRYLPEGHRELRDQQADEQYAYFDTFLSRSPAGVRQQFTSQHAQSVNTRLLGLSDLARNMPGHSRMNGDWRYLNGVQYNTENNKWQPAYRRVSPGSSLREIFFADLDQGLGALAEANEYARGVRDFYLAYPHYVGPDVNIDDD